MRKQQKAEFVHADYLTTVFSLFAIFFSTATLLLPKKQTMNTQEKQNYGKALADAAREAWETLESMRAKRQRNKNYTYGNQWCDIMTDEYGNRTTEYRHLKENGKDPLSNNLIRQLVKSVIGRFQAMNADNGEESTALAANAATELDSRAFEEFLISGCCFQKVWQSAANGQPFARIDNVNPERMFLNPTADVRGWDCELIGQLHDFSLSDLLERFAEGSRSRAVQLLQLFDNVGHTTATRQLAGTPTAGSFSQCTVPGKIRIIELWKRESREAYECHDRKTGEIFTVGLHDKAAIEEENRQRQQNDEPTTATRWTLQRHWRCYWLTPDGDIISQYDSPYRHRSHPFVFKLYPLTDGEVHSMVEDVIDQQKYVNRLITLVDHIMGASAKGALLYPDNILPEGYTWEDLRYAWSKPDSIIPYHPRGAGDKPQQVSANATNIGAYEMLDLQMKLFEQISGVSGVLKGQTSQPGAGIQLYEKEIENATIALNDIFETFKAFRAQRNEKLAAV